MIEPIKPVLGFFNEFVTKLLENNGYYYKFIDDSAVIILGQQFPGSTTKVLSLDCTELH